MERGQSAIAPSDAGQIEPALALDEIMHQRTPMSPLLAIEDLHFARGERPILSGFNLRQAHGEHRLLLGPSGSGKSTLINLVAGLLTPDSGRVLLNGSPMPADAKGRDALRRRDVSIIFQSLRLVSALSLQANLTLAARLSGKPADGIPALLNRLGLQARAQAMPRELSQGEAQRAAIARALVTRPALLLADEPTSALDDRNADLVGQLLVEAAAEAGSTLLVATHDARLKAHIPGALRLGA